MTPQEISKANAPRADHEDRAGTPRVAPGDQSSARKVTPSDQTSTRKAVLGDQTSTRKAVLGDQTSTRKAVLGDQTGPRKAGPSDQASTRKAVLGDQTESLPSRRDRRAPPKRSWRRPIPGPPTRGAISANHHRQRRPRARDYFWPGSEGDDHRETECEDRAARAWAGASGKGFR